MKEKLKQPTITAPLLVIFVLTAMHFSRNALTNLQPDTNIFVAVGVIQLATLALPCMIYYLIKGRNLHRPMYIVSRSGPQILFLIFASMFFISGSLLIKFLYYTGGSELISLVNYYGDISGTYAESSHVEIILSLIVIPAVCEELFFRGIIFSEYRAFGTANAVIVSALCFSMLHFSFENFFIYLFIGLLLGFITAVARSIIPSIALHLLSNTLNIYASDAFLRVTMIKNGEYFIGFVLTMFAGISLVLMLARVETIFLSYSENPPIEYIPPKSSKNFTKVFFSPTFIFLAVIFICYSLF